MASIVSPASTRMIFSKISRLCLPRNLMICVPTFLSRSSSSLIAEKSYASSLRHAPVKLSTSNANNCIAYHRPFNHKHNNYQRQGLAFSTRRRRRRRQGGGTPVNPVEDGSDVPAANHPTVPSAGHSTALSSEQFRSASKSLLDKVESALTKLKDCNDGLEIIRSSKSADKDSDPDDQQHGGQLSIKVQSAGDLYWGGGTYLLTVHPNDAESNPLGGNDSSDGSGGFLTLRSPLSGLFTYVYNASAEEWVGNEDGHSLLGMLTRDWIRQCRGVPDF